jgi:hypothetical protein
MPFNLDRKDAKRCITFSSYAVMISWQHLLVAVQGWFYHRLQADDLSGSVVGPIPISETTACRIHYEHAKLDHDELEDFLDTYEDEYPLMTESLIVTKVEIVSIASLV